MIVAYKAPHEPFIAQPRYLSLFKDMPVANLFNATAEEVQKLPFALKHSMGHTLHIRADISDSVKEEGIRDYLRLAAGLSDSITQITKAAQSTNNNTVMMATSDNGMLLGEHGLKGK